ncbi:MAG: T9SS type A sorting domain-containing protein, partial [Candidatus Marinimicrobia bacterium]|nr:T9SS type A sorting domain-containing protein [Candidatus Neomarinimicrobiota bacterium]
SALSYDYDYSVKSMVGINDSLILLLEEGGFVYFDLKSKTFSSTYRTDIVFNSMIPLHLDDDGRIELAATVEFQGQNALILMDEWGHFLNNWPRYGNYTQIRAAKNGNDVRIFALDGNGKLEVFNTDADIINTHPASSDAATFFLFEENDSVKIAVNGSIWASDCNEVIWGHENFNYASMNWVQDIQMSNVISETDLIRDDLIYNYPNPVSGEFTRFRYEAVTADMVEITIYNYAGRKLEHLTQIPVKGQVNEILWSVKDLASGVYIAKIEISNAQTSKTYIIKPAILK